MELSMTVGVFNLALFQFGAGFMFRSIAPASTFLNGMGSFARFHSWQPGIR